jgi:4-hydroxy-3-methylbut-2-enyl diphosphate reductase
MGVCFGVRDALKCTDVIARPVQVTVYGELVHNPIVQQRLRKRGFQQTGEGNGRDHIPDTPQVLITAHGISASRRKQLALAGKSMIDTTCPLVKKAHAAAMRLQEDGFHVLLIGRPGHVEVQGIIEDLASVDVVPDAAHVQTYPHARLGIMCQTTTPSELVMQVRTAVAERNPQAAIKFIDTVCQPTKDRQDALEELLHQVQVMVVLGGANSNNTQLLAQRCRQRGIPAYHIQSEEELKLRWFCGVDIVGLTAGTSTLPETIEEVYQSLCRISASLDQPVAAGATPRWLPGRESPRPAGWNCGRSGLPKRAY